MKAEIARRILQETAWLTTATHNALEAELDELERLATEYQSPENQRLIAIGRATEKADHIREATEKIKAEIANISEMYLASEDFDEAHHLNGMVKGLTYALIWLVEDVSKTERTTDKEEQQ